MLVYRNNQMSLRASSPRNQANDPQDLQKTLEETQQAFQDTEDVTELWSERRAGRSGSVQHVMYDNWIVSGQLQLESEATTAHYDQLDYIQGGDTAMSVQKRHPMGGSTLSQTQDFSILSKDDGSFAALKGVEGSFYIAQDQETLQDLTQAYFSDKSV